MIVAEGLSKFYGSRKALDALSFTIQDGEVVGFLGLNGAGKTTVLKILSGMLMPSAGSVSIDDVDFLEVGDSVRERIGFLPESPPLYHDMTVVEMLRYAAELNGLSAGEARRRVDEVLDSVELGHVANDLVEWLSQGYRQRLGIAMAIVHRPALVILDEPNNGLDPKQIVEMRSLIRTLAEQHTIILSSHILAEISQTCDRLLVLHEGRLVAQGSERELVQGGRAADLQLMVRDPHGVAESVMATLDGVTCHEILQHAHDTYRLRVSVDDLGAREKMVEALVQAQIGLHRMGELEGALESIFLKLTESGAHHQGKKRGLG